MARGSAGAPPAAPRSPAATYSPQQSGIIKSRALTVIVLAAAALAIGLIGLGARSAHGQSASDAAQAASPAASQPSPSATFEVADVHASARSTNPDISGGQVGDRFAVRNATLLDLIGFGWEIDEEKIVGGPAWLSNDRFDVVAKAPAGSSQEAMSAMVKNLLADRFKLAVHNDTRPISAFALTVEKGGPKMTRSTGTGDPGCDFVPQNGTPEPGSVAMTAYTCHNMTMAALENYLPQIGGRYFWDTPVVNQTKLDGAWDFTLEWTPKFALAAGNPDAVTIFDAAQKQLGLKLTLTKIPLPVIVVDSANEKPTPNAPGVGDKLPPAPTAFEVADIKPSAPDTPIRGPRGPANPAGFINLDIQNGGRVVIKTSTIKQMIMFAWDLPNDKIFQAPAFTDKEQFEIVAQAPASGAASTVGYDDDAVRLMLRSLLADRFKLTVHNQDETLPVYALISLKPKLTAADPANRSDCQNVPTTTNTVVTRLMTCQNTTMAQFADAIKRFAPGYLSQHPVVDATGVSGAWDIKLAFSPNNLVQAGASSGDQADPNAPISLFDALQSQLGLKLEMQKRPVPVLVIDYVEEPTPN